MVVMNSDLLMQKKAKEVLNSIHLNILPWFSFRFRFACDIIYPKDQTKYKWCCEDPPTDKAN
tara:strand:+ start:416 stop:601 length:186 start_codon:yes stop_codon:yes gene_type:complete